MYLSIIIGPGNLLRIKQTPSELFKINFWNFLFLKLTVILRMFSNVIIPSLMEIGPNLQIFIKKNPFNQGLNYIYIN